MPRLSWLLISCVAFVLMLSGCQRGPRVVAVSGQVLIDGQPVKSGFIRFIPTDSRAASSEIDSEGRFRLTTNTDFDGCVVGTHQVEVIANEHPTQTETRWLTPRKYADISTSGLRFTIDRAQTDLKVELTWGGEQPLVEKSVADGDVPP